MGGSSGDGSLSAVADYKVEGELEYIELDNATEYIFDCETLELSFTTEVLDDASSKNIVGVEVSMSYNEDEEANENFENKTQGMSLNKKIETTNLENMENNLKSAPEGILPSDVADDIENIPQTQIESLLSERKSLLSQ